MALYFTALNSGSNGNCYYVGTANEAILIDAGLSCRETEKRMNRLGLDITKIKAVFISHEHKDHVSGLQVISKKYNLPVYITKGTQQNGKVTVEKKLLNRFRADKSVKIGELLVTAFTKMHDAGDPHSFTVSYSNITIGVFTDIGIVCENLTHHFKQCHAAFLESNYDENMLANGNYPTFLKHRITDGKGHLSNKQALDLFVNNKPAIMSHLILSHLSENNNDPAIVLDLFRKHCGNTKIVIASRFQETALFAIDIPKIQSKKTIPSFRSTQLSLFTISD